MSESNAERVTVIGAGTMGRGIAYVAALSGHTVILTDADASGLERSIRQIEQLFEIGVVRGKLAAETRDAAVSRISKACTVEDAVQSATIVIEAVPEQMELKRQLFATIDAAAPPGALLATNTSSLSVSEIALSVRTPGRLVGMHFFNPVHAMRLIEIVRGRETSDTTLTHARAFAESLGKTSIVVNDTPGFATSRLGVVIGLEALRMLEQGVASAEDIDTAMKLGYNHPMGPLELGDTVGLDVRLAIADHLYATLGDDTYAAPDILRRLVAEGKLGKKTGEGVYQWSERR